MNTNLKKGDRVATANSNHGKTGEIIEVRDGYATVHFTHDRPSGRILTAGYYPVSQLIPIASIDQGSTESRPTSPSVKAKATTADVLGTK